MKAMLRTIFILGVCFAPGWLEAEERDGYGPPCTIKSRVNSVDLVQSDFEFPPGIGAWLSWAGFTVDGQAQLRVIDRTETPQNSSICSVPQQTTKIILNTGSQVSLEAKKFKPLKALIDSLECPALKVDGDGKLTCGTFISAFIETKLNCEDCTISVNLGGKGSITLAGQAELTVSLWPGVSASLVSAACMVGVDGTASSKVSISLDGEVSMDQEVDGMICGHASISLTIFGYDVIEGAVQRCAP